MRIALEQHQFHIVEWMRKVKHVNLPRYSYNQEIDEDSVSSLLFGKIESDSDVDVSEDDDSSDE